MFCLRVSCLFFVSVAGTFAKCLYVDDDASRPIGCAILCVGGGGHMAHGEGRR